mmetsp:Transcript_18659/g.26443  ORF Transcript_18659/g.26443 Transcript_18659/m.26443 type:complete len:535 (+) Transcript_18659:98-1702(+)
MERDTDAANIVEKKKRSAGSAAVFNALNSQIKEREAERLTKIQQQRAAELASLKERNAASLDKQTEDGSSSKLSTVKNNHNRLLDISRVVEGKSSIVASMKNAMNLDEKATATKHVVFDLNDFYMKQRSESVKSQLQKGEAAEYLHRRGASSSATSPDLPQGAEAYFRSVAGDVIVENKNQTTYPFHNKDYRAFVFVIHNDFGLLLLHCTRKRKKGPHFQIPGGHVDEAEFIAAARKNLIHPKMHLAYAAKRAAARELFEETGLDFRDQLDRFEPAHLYEQPSKPDFLTFEHKHRIYFRINVNDNDFFQQKTGDARLSKDYTMPLCGQGSYLFLKLSHEHSGFTFENDLKNAPSLLKQHSGGHCSEALSSYLSFLASGKVPEPIDAPCEWKEKELLVAQQQSPTIQTKQAKTTGATSKPSSVQFSQNSNQKNMESQHQQRTQVNSTTANVSRGKVSASKYQDEYKVKKLEPPPKTNISMDSVGMEDTPRSNFTYEEGKNALVGQLSSWCCWCFRKKAPQTLSSPYEGTALLRRG